MSLVQVAHNQVSINIRVIFLGTTFLSFSSNLCKNNCTLCLQVKTTAFSGFSLSNGQYPPDNRMDVVPIVRYKVDSRKRPTMGSVVIPKDCRCVAKARALFLNLWYLIVSPLSNIRQVSFGYESEAFKKRSGTQYPSISH
eukprot:TRINITY_DN6866_c0_g2_i6.p2 TRINITY_DN6866_c0_g2~~TRINITY_DN6866_c0_g2_i6.p2  ORF type:complete len:140 (+),score=25.65 TRINITY_DN6866_c0_g2_i6:739-1158(+)